LTNRSPILLLIYLLTFFGNAFATECSLTLEAALERAWRYSTSLGIAQTEVNVKLSEEYQSSLWPNPIASVEVDDGDSLVFKRNKSDDKEIYYSVSQLIELGGKRSARQREAACQTNLVLWELEGVKLDLHNLVVKAFIDAMAAQEYVKVAQEQQNTSEKVLSTVSAKVQAGKLSPLQIKKAEIAQATAALALEKAERASIVAKKKLAATWGCSVLDFNEVTFPLFNIELPPSLESLTAQQCQNPEMIKWEVEICAAFEALAREKAQVIPDVVVTGGYVNSCGSHNDSWTLGIAMPIPIFDRNQGNISRASQQLCQLYEKQKENLLQLNLALTETYEELVTAYKEGVAVKENILSSAMEAFDTAQEGYSKGKFDYLELLDSQRTLFEIQEQYINTLVEYHHKRADVSRLVGGCLQE
jgi:cobalt-zinc-cadmium efflux system outer membrane protein